MTTTKLTLCLVAVCSVTGHPQEHAAQKIVTRAEAALAANRPEDAALLLRKARLAVGRSDKVAGADAVVARIKELLSKVDPLLTERAKAEAKVATTFSKLADEYGSKGWKDSAKAMLERGEVFDPLVVAGRLRKLRGPSKKVPTIIEYFEAGRQVYVTKDKWKFENGVVTSPQPRTSAMLLLSDKSVDSGTKTSGTRISVDVKTGPGGRAGLVFAYRGRGYHMVEVIHHGGRSEIRMYRWHDGEWDKIHARYHRLPRSTHTGWFPLVVETRGNEISWQVGPSPVFVDKTSAKRLSGKIGLLVGSSSRDAKPVEFKNLVIKEL